MCFSWVPHPSYQHIWLGKHTAPSIRPLANTETFKQRRMINSIFNRAPALTLNLGLRLSKTANTQRTYSRPWEQARETVQVAGRKTEVNYKEKVHWVNRILRWYWGWGLKTDARASPSQHREEQKREPQVSQSHAHTHTYLSKAHEIHHVDPGMWVVAPFKGHCTAKSWLDTAPKGQYSRRSLRQS